jgi:hypothetical protein
LCHKIFHRFQPAYSVTRAIEPDRGIGKKGQTEEINLFANFPLLFYAAALFLFHIHERHNLCYSIYLVNHNRNNNYTTNINLLLRAMLAMVEKIDTKSREK